MSVLREGDTCWRIARADRFAFLVDAHAYFEAFQAAVEQAKRSLRLLAWDFDDRVALNGDPTAEPRLGTLLQQAIMSGIDVDIVLWRWPLFMAAARQWFPLWAARWRHPNLHFRQAGHALHGGSHHQKVAVVDDQLAFVGGIDFARHRWDTRRHRLPNPFHDVMVALDGPAGAAVAELVRDRCAQAGLGWDKVQSDVSPWPGGLTADLRGVPVGIARTDPHRTSFELEALHVQAIRSARRRIYIENQYLSSKVLWVELARRLRERAGPEVFIVAPERCMNAAERLTMGVFRERWVRRLRRFDHGHRLRVVAPVVAERSVFVHSKVLVVDDDLAVVGSANWTARSLRLDTECAVAVEANGDPRVQGAIAGFRDGLLAEHLGARREDVAAAVHSGATLAAVARKLPAGQRGFRAIGVRPPPWWEHALPDEAALDPPGPMRSCAYGVWLIVRTVGRIGSRAVARGGAGVMRWLRSRILR